ECARQARPARDRGERPARRPHARRDSGPTRDTERSRGDLTRFSPRSRLTPTICSTWLFYSGVRLSCGVRGGLVRCRAGQPNRGFIRSKPERHAPERARNARGGADRPTGGGGDGPVTKPKTKSILAAG